MEIYAAILYVKENVFLFLLAAMLLIAAMTDLRFRKIPNWLTLPSVLAGAGLHAALNGLDGLLFSIAGAAVGIGLLIIPYVMGGMGAGDVKLLGAVGGLLGSKMVIVAFLCTAIVGGLYAVCVVVRQGSLKETVDKYRFLLTTLVVTRQVNGLPTLNAAKGPTICYGVAISLGTLLAVLLANNPFAGKMLTSFI